MPDQRPATRDQRPTLHNGFKARVFAACLAFCAVCLFLVRDSPADVSGLAQALLLFASAVIAGRSAEQWSYYRRTTPPPANHPHETEPPR